MKVIESIMEVIMKQATLTIRVENELKEKITRMAKKQRRSLADETAYLMEIGLKVMEQQPDPIQLPPNPAA
jgi:hypothetical protein